MSETKKRPIPDGERKKKKKKTSAAPPAPVAAPTPAAAASPLVCNKPWQSLVDMANARVGVLTSVFPNIMRGHKISFPTAAFLSQQTKVARSSVNKFVDHTFLKQGSIDDIDRICQEAVKHKFKAVCVNGAWVKRCTANIAQSGAAAADRPLVCTVVGFPLGQTTTASKAFEAACAVGDGAREVDMVINVACLKRMDYNSVYEDILAVRNAIPSHIVLKVIFETCLLSPEQICDAAILSRIAGADFIKTSTGFSDAGATMPACKIMRVVAAGCMEVKASGGVRTWEAADAYLSMGVTRLGTSSGLALLPDAKPQAAGSGY